MTARYSLGPHAPRRHEAPWRWLLFALILLVFILLTVRPAAAENLGPGGGSRLIAGDEVVGPYRLLITSSPNPATTGTVTFVVRVSDPQSGVKVRDATVDIELTPADGSAAIKDQATHKNSGNEVDYAAHVPMQAGSWNGVIRVTGAAGTSEVKFLQSVAPPRTFSTVILVGLPFLVMIGVLGAMYFMRTNSRKAASA